RHPPADRDWQKGYLDRRPRPKEKTHCPPKVDRTTTRFILVVFGVRRSSPLWIGRIKAAKNAALQKKTNFRPHLSRSRDASSNLHAHGCFYRDRPLRNSSGNDPSFFQSAKSSLSANDSGELRMALELG